MIRINEQFSINKHKEWWELRHTTPSKDIDGNQNQFVWVSYHPDIRTVLSLVIDRSVGDCLELSEIINKIDSVIDDLAKALLAA